MWNAFVSDDKNVFCITALKQNTVIFTVIYSEIRSNDKNCVRL